MRQIKNLSFLGFFHFCLTCGEDCVRYARGFHGRLYIMGAQNVNTFQD
jgi:hypothetical protein